MSLFRVNLPLRNGHFDSISSIHIARTEIKTLAFDEESK